MRRKKIPTLSSGDCKELIDQTKRGTFTHFFDAKISRSRNELVVRIPKVIEERFQITTDKNVRFTLTTTDGHESYEIRFVEKGARTPQPTLDPHERAIVGFLASVNTSNTYRMAKKLQMSWTTANKKLGILQGMGIVKPVPYKRGILQWSLT